ncbi:MAG TPA: ribosome biogenesis GTP-binding protein YihA/YsxC [Clostridia bacterium]|nr:ribosome biogenesis GTP-binding protein YihA/YsxC [Clostridia bacterium]
MSDFQIKKASFLKSVGAGGTDWPSGVHIAMVGRSNVGKSSLINSLCSNNKLARISASPGKTRLINFYDVNDGAFYLVDLPGYGYAKVSKVEQERWAGLIESYLSSGAVTHIFLLIDIRHEPTAGDRQMLQWIIYYGVPFTLIAMKADKIAKAKRAQAARAAAKLLGAPPYAVAYSSETGEGKDELVERIGAIAADAANLPNNQKN